MPAKPVDASTPLAVRKTTKEEMNKRSQSHKPNAADAAVRLIARHLLQGLRKMDWQEWKEKYVRDPEKLEKTVGILARLSRELRAQEAEKEKRAPTAEEIEEIERRLNLL